MVLVEAAVETLEEALAAEAAGVDRVEVCGAPLDHGGLTPDAALVQACVSKLRIPVHVLIRPRLGDFVYSAEDIGRLRAAVAMARSHGAAGVAIGALTRDGRIDLAAVRELVTLARPMRVCFHRAFDQLKDQSGAVDTLAAMGVDLILTSGGARSAVEGIDRLRDLVAQANGRVTILAAGSITAEHVRAIVERTGVTEVHGRKFQGVKEALKIRH